MWGGMRGDFPHVVQMPAGESFMACYGGGVEHVEARRLLQHGPGLAAPPPELLRRAGPASFNHDTMAQLACEE